MNEEGFLGEEEEGEEDEYGVGRGENKGLNLTMMKLAR